MKKNHKKSLKRISAAALAATVAFSTPSVLTALNDGNPVGGVEVYAAEVTNLMNSNDTLTQFNVNYHEDYAHWVHRFHNDGEIPVENDDFDITGLKYVVKFPDELAHLLDNQYTKDYLFGQIKNFDAAQNAFTFTGTAIDEDGNEVTIHKDNHKPFEHISVNNATNSIEFDFASFYQANNLEPHIRQSVAGDYFLNTLGFQTPIVVSDDDLLNNGSYTFKTAIVRGNSINLDNVSNAYEEVLNIDYSTDPEPEIDKNALTSLIDEAKGYEAEDYIEASFASLSEALTAAEEVAANDDATQEEVDSALSSLEAAIDGLEDAPTPDPEVDKAALRTLIDEAKVYVAEDYTEASFASLSEALTAAEEVASNDDATEEEVDSALSSLEAAIDGLEDAPTPDPEVDKAALRTLIDEAKAYVAEDYTEASFSSLTEALTAAEEVVANDDATEEEVDVAESALQNAVDGLEEESTSEPEVDKAELEDLVEEAKGHVKEDYTKESFAPLVDAVQAAEDVLANEDATEDEVNEAQAELEKAIDGLEELPVDKEALTSLVEEMNALDVEDFSKKSFEALTEALTAAEDVLANENPTQKEIDAAVDAILTAKDDLERVEPIENSEVDVSELVALLQEAKRYVKEDYTSETYAALLDAIHNAEELLETKAATEEAVQEVLDSLKVAINGLKEVVQEKPDVEENDEEESLIVDGNLLPKTATNTYTMGLIGGLLAVVGGVLVAVRKRLTNLFN